jgi:hypothetical protein
MKKSLYFVVGITIILTLLIVGPLVVIWSLNTLFPVLAISFTWKTWLATVVLIWIINPTVKIRGRV